MAPKYTARLTATAQVYTPSDDETNVARASSLDQLKGLMPSGIDVDDQIDLVFIVGNLAVGGTVNLNDDAVTLEDGLAIYRGFEMRQVNVEHNRKQIVGFILKAGLSELGTNRLITEAEARESGVPYNIVTVAALWRVANKDLCNFIVDNALSGITPGALSLSFEVGFNDYSVVCLPEGTTDLAKATLVIPHDSPEFEKYDKMLRINGGKGKVGKSRVARILAPPLVPLGQGVVTVPAAAVKGIVPILSTPDTWSSSVDAGNGYQYSSTQLDLSPEDAAPILEYGKMVDDADLYPSQEGVDSYGPDYGRETQSHITALYGIKDSNVQPIMDACSQFAPIEVTLGKVSAFKHADKGYDVLKVDVDSPHVHALNAALKSVTDHDDKWPEFRPHLTVAYVNKGASDKYVGDTRFEGKKLTFASLTYSPAQGDKVTIPFKPDPTLVYTPDMLAKANRMKLPAGLADKAKKLNYPKADVTLSDGRVLKGVTVFNGEELDLDKDLDLNGVVITDMNPQMPPQIDDSPTIHPHIDDQFPTETPEKRAKNAANEALKDVLRNMPYTDAILKHLEAAARILQIIGSESGVSTTTASSNPSLSSTMKLEDIKQLEAKVKAATTPETINEAWANVALFVEAISKASEKYVKDKQDAEKSKEDTEKACAQLKTDLAEAKKTLDEVKAAQALATAEAAFQSRMIAVNAHFSLDDDVRGEIVSEIRACADDTSFEKWFARAKKLMKGYIKAASEDVDSQDKTPHAGSGTQGVQSKENGKDTVDSTEAKKAAKKADDKEDDACMAANKTAIASAKSNPIDSNIDVIGDVAANGSLMEQYSRAFSKGVTVGGKTLDQFKK